MPSPMTITTITTTTVTITAVHRIGIIAIEAQNPPDTVGRNPGFRAVLGAGALLGFLVHAPLLASRCKKDS